MALVEKRRLGDILVRAGKINHFQLQEALKSQKILGKKLGEILVEQNIMTEQDIIEAIEEQTGIQQVNLNELFLINVRLKQSHKIYVKNMD